MRDREVIYSYEFDDEQFDVLAEDDSTPAGAWPTYVIDYLANWLLNDLPLLRPERLLHGDLVLKEHHDGVISYASDSSIMVRYGSGDDEFEAEYLRSQFENGASLNRGDEIEAVFGLLRVSRPTVSLDSLYTDDQQRELESDWQQRKGVIGDLDL